VSRWWFLEELGNFVAAGAAAAGQGWKLSCSCTGATVSSSLMVASALAQASPAVHFPSASASARA
jgi:hypothetical protein